MEELYGGFFLEFGPGTFPLSTDSVVLAHFVRLPRNAKVLDLGSGCATLGIMLCARDPGCQVTGLELTPQAHEAALANIRRNRLEDRCFSICTDLRRFSEEFPAETFSCVVSNPPYFSGGPASKVNPVARREDCCTPEDLFRTASRALRYGGDFFLVHKPERLAQLIVQGAACQLEVKELTLIRHREGGEVSMILLRFRKGGKPGLQLHEACLFDSQGEPTGFYREVYHI